MAKKESKTHNQRSKKQKVKGMPKAMDTTEFEALQLEERISLIQELIPIGLMAVAKELNREVEDLVGRKYSRDVDAQAAQRFGYNPGTVRLGGQLLPIKVPRVRNSDGEIPLKSYELLHSDSELESDNILKKVLSGVPVRKIAAILPQSDGSIGTSKSSVSRKVVAASSAKLKSFQKRDLSGWPIIAMFIDGTSFAEDMMVISLGVCLDGSKRVLGFVQSGTENNKPIAQMLRDLKDRGLSFPHGFIAIIDGSKGIRKAVVDVFGKAVLIQRCQWHKRENVVGYMAKGEQAAMRRRLQTAYERPVLSEAKTALTAICSDLSVCNLSAKKSLEEGLSETLTLHKINMFALFGISLKTTNCIESLNAGAKDYCSHIDYWKNSSQKCRWLATAILDIETGFRKIRGFKMLSKLCKAVEKHVKLD